MGDISKFFELFSNILTIIGFLETEKDDFITRFFILVETKLIQRIYVRLDKEGQEQLDTILGQFEDRTSKQSPESIDKYNSDIEALVQDSISSRELRILFDEILEDLFSGFMSDILEKTTETQRQQIEGLVASMQK